MNDLAHPQNPATVTRRPRSKGDDKAVASFILGLVGLFVFNVVLGPFALVLGGVALAQGTARRGRALLGIALGVADLVVLVVLMATHDGMNWPLS